MVLVVDQKFPTALLSVIFNSTFWFFNLVLFHFFEEKKRLAIPQSLISQLPTAFCSVSVIVFKAISWVD